MKKYVIKYLSSALLCCAAFAAGGCDDPEISGERVNGTKDTYAYIVGGNEAQFRAATCDIIHTPDGSLGTVSMDITVALTKTSESAVTCTLELDESLFDKTCSAVPNGFIDLPQAVIAAGEKTATVRVSIPAEKFPEMTDPQYMAAVRIASANGVTVSSNLNAAYLYIDVKTIDPKQNMIAVSAESRPEFTVLQYTDATLGDQVTQTITVNASEAAYLDTKVTLGVDNSLVEAGYATVPEEWLTFMQAVIAKDATSAQATVSIADEYLPQLTEEKYMVPVVVKSAGPSTVSPNSKTTYLIINVKKYDFVSSFFSSLYLGDCELATNYVFADPIDLTAGFSIVFKCYIEELTEHSRIGDFCDASENWINMLRFGQKADKGILEWFVGPSVKRQNLYSTTSFEVGKWYQVALTYDGTTYKMYVNGTEEASATASATSGMSFQRIEFNSSWGGYGYRNGNEFHGRLAEISIWDSAQTTSALNAILCGIPDSNTYMRRVKAYWKCGDGSGHVLEEATGKYEDIDFSKTERDNDDGHGMTPTDVSQYVVWRSDSNNICTNE